MIEGMLGLGLVLTWLVVGMFVVVVRDKFHQHTETIRLIQASVRDVEEDLTRPVAWAGQRSARAKTAEEAWRYGGQT